jgi:O-antigen/teichoic acid export membrane protein
MLGGVAAQGSQALASFGLQLLAARTLGLDGLGQFAILYGIILLITAVVSGFVGDTLTVLDRRDPSIRFTLQLWCLGLSLGTGLCGAAVALATDLLAPPAAWIFGGAIIVFVFEDTIRRLLMAHLLFWKIVAVDLAGLAGALAALGLAANAGALSLGSFFAAIIWGQLLALAIGIMLLPKSDRFLVLRVQELSPAVARYGVWRSLQQAVRPALLTTVRITVTLLAGLAATGQLELARIYVAPIMLIVSGASSYLFTAFARQSAVPIKEMLRRADRGVAALTVVALGAGIIAMALLSSMGHLVAGQQPEAAAVLGWIVYATSVAAVTPYGALAAVRGKQAGVLGLRLADSVISLLLVGAFVALTGGFALVPLLMAIGSVLGGPLIRGLLIRPLLISEIQSIAVDQDPRSRKVAHRA